MFFCRGKKNGRGGRACPETVSTLKKVRDYRKLLIPLRCSEIVSKWPSEKTENDFEVSVRSENFRQPENDAFLDGNRRPDVEIRFWAGFYRDFRHLSPADGRISPRAHNGVEKIPSLHAASLPRRYPWSSPPRNDTSRTGASMSWIKTEFWLGTNPCVQNSVTTTSKVVATMSFISWKSESLSWISFPAVLPVYNKSTIGSIEKNYKLPTKHLVQQTKTGKETPWAKEK